MFNLSEDNVIDFPISDEALELWPMQKYAYINTVAISVFGDDLGFELSPAKLEDGTPIFLLVAGSLKYESILGKAVIRQETMESVRRACIFLAQSIFMAEFEYEEKHNKKVYVPKAPGLIIPGR